MRHHLVEPRLFRGNMWLVAAVAVTVCTLPAAGAVRTVLCEEFTAVD
jgi:hypothetical protein